MQPQGQGMERDEKERENGGISKGAEQAWEERPGMSRGSEAVGVSQGDTGRQGWTRERPEMKGSASEKTRRSGATGQRAVRTRGQQQQLARDGGGTARDQPVSSGSRWCEVVRESLPGCALLARSPARSVGGRGAPRVASDTSVP